MTTSRRHSNSRRDSRRKNNKKVLLSVLVACSNCGAMKLSHRICKECGYYNGKLVVAKKIKEKQPRK
ncbi:MAG: 50S ribosomal protein L32 [Candidatus Omnitrophica bacterium]|nr:50S ribosomal protein L32 [Candidatus Omnitrophota bacterium]